MKITRPPNLQYINITRLPRLTPPCSPGVHYHFIFPSHHLPLHLLEKDRPPSGKKDSPKMILKWSDRPIVHGSSHRFTQRHLLEFFIVLMQAQTIIIILSGRSAESTQSSWSTQRASRLSNRADLSAVSCLISLSRAVVSCLKFQSYLLFVCMIVLW